MQVSVLLRTIRLLTLAVAVAATLSLAPLWNSSASAVTITFTDVGVSPLTTTYDEGGYRFEVISGGVWQILPNTGNPGSKLSTGGTPPAVGDQINIYRIGGGQFTFDQFDFTGFISSPSDTVNFLGSVSAVPTEQLLAFGVSNAAWQTTSPGFGGPIDLLSIVIDSAGSTDLQFDNLVFTNVDATVAVPEPGTCTLLALGLVGLGIRRRRVKRS